MASPSPDELTGHPAHATAKEVKQSEKSKSPASSNSPRSDDESDAKSSAIHSKDPELPEEPKGPDGWVINHDPNTQLYYFYNCLTQESSWTDPRHMDASDPAAQSKDPQAISDKNTKELDSDAPPLPAEAPPESDDGWECYQWAALDGPWCFYNRFTQQVTSDNPRVPGASSSSGVVAPGSSSPPSRPVAGGYNPAIHGDYDPNADYAKAAAAQEEQEEAAQQYALQQQVLAANPDAYTATGTFNRFTGKWQSADKNPEYHNDENKSRRQGAAWFDVDAAANSHDGRSLKDERRGKKLTKAELKAFQKKRRDKKEEKRRAWLRD